MRGAHRRSLGSEEMVTINQLVDIVADIAGKKIEKNHIAGPTGVRGRNSDNRLIKKAWLGALAIAARGPRKDLSVDRMASPPQCGMSLPRRFGLLRAVHPPIMPVNAGTR